MHLLIPYVYLPGHEDPLFAEYTYADGAARARKMKRDLHKGDYVFFHTSFRGAKHITAYYIVDRVLDVATSASDTAIRAKYRNPHLVSYINKYEDGTRGDDAILFGDPILSRILPRPLPFTRALGQKLAFNFKFKPGRTETQSIGSATRAWRSLTSKQVKTLLKQIARWDTHLQKIAPVRSSEEVAEVLERDIETYLASAPSVLGKRLTLHGRQVPLGAGRIDLIYKNQHNDLIIVEIKLGQIGHDAVSQLRQYVKDYAKHADKKGRGILVCSGVLPAYRAEIAKLKDIAVFTYGWRMQVTEWTG